MPVSVDDLLEQLEQEKEKVEEGVKAKARISVLERLIVLYGAITPAQSKKVRKKSPYPELCVLPENLHREGVNLVHSGKGLCSSHKQRLIKGTLSPDEVTIWKREMKSLGLESVTK